MLACNLLHASWTFMNIHTKAYCISLNLSSEKLGGRTSLVAQWKEISLPIQGTQARYLFWEKITCHGVAKPACHNYGSLHSLGCASHNSELLGYNYWACTLEPLLCNKRSHCNGKPTHHTKSSSHWLQLEKALGQQQRPSMAKKERERERKTGVDSITCMLICSVVSDSLRPYGL